MKQILEQGRGTMLSIGLMTGTSMDGIDAALIKTDGNISITELGNIYLPFTDEQKLLFKSAELAVRNAGGDMTRAANSFQSLGAAIQLSTKLHLQAVELLLQATNHKDIDVDVIGYHGQCLFHSPLEKISVIVGDGQYLADKVGITVVNDFRSNDIAHGGQGAPFAPLYHRALAVRDGMIPVAVVNCGGIANITLITGPEEDDIIGFDTGPGNGLIDKLVRERTSGKEFMDRDGKHGSAGTVHKEVIEALYQKSVSKYGKNFFEMIPPKALDIGDMTLIPELESLSIEDACATLEAFTADTIIDSLKFAKIDVPKKWILAGGGWNNPVILKNLEERLPGINIMTADEAGWNSQAMEAQIFAYFAVRSLQGKSLSLPSTTGVSRAMTGGKIYQPSAKA